MKNTHRVVVFIIALFFITIVFGCSKNNVQSSNSILYDTPEKAVSEFIGAIAEGNFDLALSLYPVDQIKESYNYNKELEILEALGSTVTSYSELDKQVNRDKDMERFRLQLVMFFSSFITFNDIETENDLLQFLKESDSRELAKINIVSIDKPLALFEAEKLEGHYENMQVNTDIFGADEITERIALIECCGRRYIAGFRLIKYEDSWGIESLTSTFAGFPVLGEICTITEKEYDSKIALK